MKKIIFLVLFFISAGNCFGQQVTFQKIFGGLPGDYGYAVQQTTDSGYVIAGSTSAFGGGFKNAYLIKTNYYGDTLWTRTFGGLQNDDAKSVQQTTDGGFILAGTTESFGAIDDIYLVKTDSLGHLQWSKTYGGSSNESGLCVKQTVDGGYIITGFTTTYGLGLGDIYLIKTDANGDSLWTRTYGGTNPEMGSCILQVFDGYVITGYESSYSSGSYDSYLLKIDNAGNPVWMKAYGTAESDVGYFVASTNDGGFILTGFTEKNNNQDVILIKTDSLGDTLWTKSYEGTSPDVGYSVKQTSDGGYIIAGSTSASGMDLDCFIIKLNSIGDTLWTKIIGGQLADVAYSVQETNDHGYIISGETANFGASFREVYLIKTDSLGNSGCNEKSYTIVVSSPAIIITSAIPQVSSGGIVGTPSTLEYFGANVSTVCSNVSVNEIPSPSLTLVYPNPATNNFTITFPNTINKGVIEIYNVLGEKIFDENIFNVSQKEIRLNNINAGIYFVKVKDGEKVVRGKFLKE